MMGKEDRVQLFRGQLLSHEAGHATHVTVQVENEWVRIYSEHKRFGAWTCTDLKVERLTVFRFQLQLDGVTHTFTPDDPNGFSDSVGAVIDLRPKSRFGLGDRVKKALAEQEALREQAALTGTAEPV
jgi:hypothetical protein